MNTLSVKHLKTIKHDSSHITYQVFPSTQQVLWKGSEAEMEALHLEPATCLGAPATCQHILDSSHAPVNTTQEHENECKHLQKIKHQPFD